MSTDSTDPTRAPGIAGEADTGAPHPQAEAPLGGGHTVAVRARMPVRPYHELEQAVSPLIFAREQR